MIFAAVLLASTIDVAQYADALDRLSVLVATNRLTEAKAEAKVLEGAEVEGPNGKFAADRTLLADVGALTRPDVHLRARLATAAAEIRNAASIAAPAADPAMLDRLAAAQSSGTLQAGGEVIPPELGSLSLVERIAAWTRKAGQWVIDRIVDFFEWLSRFWPKIGQAKKTSTAGLRWIVFAVVAVIAIAIVALAIGVIRRTRAGGEPEALESEPVSSRRDDDPLSRGANEWERYAAQLAAAGRVREAIRAWYHAVLVALYGAGILRFRKGRTNWEYVAALAPSLGWRGEFVTLTRDFEHHWYGSDRSPREALDDASRRARAILDSVRRGAS
jgi:Domain of unknown function (DUF4129)